jgi:hypothetical protein
VPFSSYFIEVAGAVSRGAFADAFSAKSGTADGPLGSFGFSRLRLAEQSGWEGAFANLLFTLSTVLG